MPQEHDDDDDDEIDRAHHIAEAIMKAVRKQSVRDPIALAYKAACDAGRNFDRNAYRQIRLLRRTISLDDLRDEPAIPSFFAQLADAEQAAVLLARLPDDLRRVVIAAADPAAADGIQHGLTKRQARRRLDEVHRRAKSWRS